MRTKPWSWRQILGMLLSILHMASSSTNTHVNHKAGPIPVAVDTISFSQQRNFGSTDKRGVIQNPPERRSVQRWRKLNSNKQAHIRLRPHEPHTLVQSKFNLSTLGAHDIQIWARLAKSVSSHDARMGRHCWIEQLQKSKVNLITSLETNGIAHFTPLQCRSLNQRLRRARRNPSNPRAKRPTDNVQQVGKPLKPQAPDPPLDIQDKSDVNPTVIEGLDKAIKK